MSEHIIKSVLMKRKNSKIFIAVAAVVLFVAVLLGLGRSGGDEDAMGLSTFAAKRGPLTISITQSGTIKARDQVILKSEIEGTTSIILLIPEGTMVKEGDLLVELDVSDLLDRQIDQDIRVQNSEASFIGATENLAVVENQAKSDIDRSKLDLEFAIQDLKKYLEGEYPNALKQAEAVITLAKEELTRAQETIKWSKKLYEEKYISQTELQADELAEKRKTLDLELAKNSRDLLKDFTYSRTVAELQSDFSQATMALERVNRKAKADVIQAKADLKAIGAEFQQQKDKLTKIDGQIEKAKIYAPAAGRVIYATSAKRGGWRGGQEPLDEGQQVRERQELIHLPTASSAKVEADIHESSLQKVRLGLPVVISIDALPGEKFYGKVEKIAPLPDDQSMWINPDLKVYNTDIFLDNNNDDLRTGMSCQAEIIIAQYDDAIYVPIQAVIRVKGQTTVFVVSGSKVKPRPVEIGLDNNRMVRIISGLKEGELVSLIPPLTSADADVSTDLGPSRKKAPARTDSSPQAQGDNGQKGGAK